MITYDDLVCGFGDRVEKIGDNLFKFRITVPAFSLFNYLWCDKDSGNDYLLLSKNIENDDFAFFIYSQMISLQKIKELKKINIPFNQYGFDSIIMASSDYHGNLVGVMDDKRLDLVLCAPIYHYEFSGNESINEFREMRIKKTHIDNWNRKVEPRILVRFINKKTGGGTKGNSYILITESRLRLEINNLNGVAHSFIDVMNYQDEVIRITSGTTNIYHLSSAMDEEDMNGDVLNKKINEFLTK